MKRHSYWIGLAALLILIAVFLVFSPLVAAVIGSPMNWDAYARALREVAAPIASSAYAGVISALVAAMIGVPFGLLTERSGPRVLSFCRALGLLVFMVPPYL